ncbi:MAG: hypothetical protein KC668_19465 [Myxococcales bacterium]|nr:hypothetical protein [Myxococcales bacterium]
MSPSSRAPLPVDSSSASDSADVAVGDPAEDTHGTKPVLASAPGHARPEVEIDPTPALAQDVLALFRGPFADVRFPDVDRASLEADVIALLHAQAEVEALDRALEDARQVVKSRSEHLLGSSSRALAYAKVFALGQPTLEDAVGRVRSTPSEAGAKPRGVKKKRGAREATGVQLPIRAPVESAGDTDVALEGELAAE